MIKFSLSNNIKVSVMPNLFRHLYTLGGETLKQVQGDIAQIRHDAKLFSKFKLLFVIFALSWLPNLLVAQTPTLQLNDIRLRFSKAVKSDETCTALYNEMMEAKARQGAVFNCYLGVVTVSMGKYTINPFSKLSYFHEGKELIESGIAAEPNNVELRFLRYTVQEHVPFFLGYTEHLKVDKKFILDEVAHLEMPKLKQAIINYILNSKSFTPAEKQTVSSLH